MFVILELDYMAQFQIDTCDGELLQLRDALRDGHFLRGQVHRGAVDIDRRRRRVAMQESALLGTSSI